MLRFPRLARGTLLLLSILVGGCGDSSTTPPVGLAILSVTPEILRPGDEAVIRGQEFAESPVANRVTIQGEEVEVLEASSTRLRVRLPDFMCVPLGEAAVVVEAEGEATDPFLRAFEPVGVVELEPGDLHLATDPAELCLLLDASTEGAEYLVGTQSATEVPATLTGVRVRARVPGIPPPDTAPAGLVAFGPAGASGSLAHPTAGGSAGAPTPEDRWATHRTAERTLRTREREALARAPRGPGADPPLARSIPPAVPPTVEPGDVVSVMVPDVSENSCTDGTEIDAVVRNVGSRSIWLEDPDNPGGGFSTEEIQLLAEEFDGEIHDETVSWFGEPTDQDGNDRIVVVVSREVNRATDALAFVALSDFAGLLDTECPGANGGEYYYARAPDPEGEDGEVYTTRDALEDAPRLLAHETTHIIQFGRRLLLPAPDGFFQAIWFLEGQATFAEEVVGYRYTGAEPRLNLGAEQALATDHPPTGLGWFRIPFFDLAVYFGFDADDGAPEECTWLSVEDPEPCISGRIAYGVTWSFLRWASDHFHDRFPGGERELQRRLVDSPAWGFDTFDEVLGEDPRSLLAPWAAALYVDDRVGGDPLVDFPSWNLRDIEEALVADARLTPDQDAFGHFDRTVQVAAASTHYQLVSAPIAHEPFALAARATDGGLLPNHMQLWAVRIR